MLILIGVSNVVHRFVPVLPVPLIQIAIGLVFFTVFIVGYTVNWLIPSIPLAVAFGLAAILSPTDTLAVTSLSRRINLPNSLKNVLEGEALMNDASSLVAFKYSMVAMVTGYFSLAQSKCELFCHFYWWIFSWRGYRIINYRCSADASPERA
ncbi:cation:proton antiporter [Paenibacillus physcomitrellae]|uniref:cation:proton antiporter domain-containing protein n=1 Tax=Paenibacillus physcomitrellae TaxID=1619311 RepID=UPI003CC839B1